MNPFKILEMKCENMVKYVYFEWHRGHDHP